MLVAGIVLASATMAQGVPAPQETPRTIPGLVIAPSAPGPSATPVPIPTAPVRGLPLPAPVPSATPVRTTQHAASAGRPTVPRTPAPSAVMPTPTPTPAVESVPVPVPVPAAAVPPPVAAPAGAAPAPAVTVATTSGSSGLWPWIALAVVALLVLAGWWLIRRRAASAPMALPAPQATPTPDVPAPASAVPVQLPAELVPAGPQAQIEIALHPRRAGLNMLSAVVEGEVVVTNTGDAPATQVRVHATLLSAHIGQEADLAAAFAAPGGRPAMPPFALAPGENRRVRIIAALPREAIHSMEAGGRPMFVPLVAVDVRYTVDDTGKQAQSGRAFVVGVERIDSAKLAPFWLDAPIRMFDQIAARPQGAVVVD